MLSETAQKRVKRMIDRRQLGSDFCEHMALNLLGQPDKNVVEDVDLLFVEISGATEKKVGDLPQHFRAFGGRALLNCKF